MPTSIRLTDDTKAALEDEQEPGESFDDTVARLLGTTKGRLWTEAEINNLIDQRIRDANKQKRQQHNTFDLK